MSKFNKKRLLSIYKNPLPIDLIYDNDITFVIPQVVAHNPVSWIFFASSYLKNCLEISGQLINNTGKVHQSIDNSSQKIVVKVSDHDVFKVEIEIGTPESDAIKLWKNGFFGKGILSRSEPTWYERTERRLHLKDQYSEKDLTSEEITALRRNERKKFKQLRESYENQQLELERQISAIIDRQKIVSTKKEMLEMENDLKRIQRELEDLKLLSQQNQDFRAFQSSHKVKLYEYAGPLRPDDNALIINDPTISDKDKRKLMQLEYLQLMPVEAFFLQLALDKVKVFPETTGSNELSTLELFQRCVDSYYSSTTPMSRLAGNEKFLLDYAVYHHYRSHGWCVRSGVKFGVDFLLYEKGPPISHAQYCLHVVENSGKNMEDFVEYSSLNRVIGGVRKTLVFVCVDVPSVSTFQKIMEKIAIEKDITEQQKLWKKLLNQYNITEMVYRRWVPSRNRD
ncbi:tRNA splicing endonuclease subunit [Saccharomycopsis crataegensis]|uniref:tRNA-splicing endonuclease subunit Sen2 n=1 Tax=Saccharomycopsis crataegensis TaxID=43959 RepID=A0AAV5QWW7_9ASCO|nr:tRNA splicing endonuclease subunit [Saccharomycopsis crataegensis]